MAEMDSITRDALKRVQQMQSHMNNRNSRTKQAQSTDSSREVDKKAPEEISNIKTAKVSENESLKASAENSPKKLESMLDLLLGNKEQSLILLLFVLLMDENCDPSILLALMYLLL